MQFENIGCVMQKIRQKDTNTDSTKKTRKQNL